MKLILIIYILLFSITAEAQELFNTDLSDTWDNMEIQDTRIKEMPYAQYIEGTGWIFFKEIEKTTVNDVLEVVYYLTQEFGYPAIWKGDLLKLKFVYMQWGNVTFFLNEFRFRVEVMQ